MRSATSEPLGSDTGGLIELAALGACCAACASRAARTASAIEADFPDKRYECVEQAARVVTLNRVTRVLDAHPAAVGQRLRKFSGAVVGQHVASAATQHQCRAGDMRGAVVDELRSRVAVLVEVGRIAIRVVLPRPPAVGQLAQIVKQASPQ